MSTKRISGHGERVEDSAASVAPAPEGQTGNPYFDTGRHGAVQSGPEAAAAGPDLDAAAPALRSDEGPRLDRKALVFLGGILLLIAVMALLVFKGTGAREDGGRTMREETVVVPELETQAPLPQAPQSRTTGEQTDAVAVPLAAEPAPPLPPLPAQQALPPSASFEPMPAPTRVPSLRERRMGLVAPDAAAPGGGPGANDLYAQAMLAGLQAAQGGAPAPAAPAEPVTAARSLLNPDALLARGTYLRCILETRIVTDVAGYTSCVVTEPVYSVNGRQLLVPKGSKVLGKYQGEPEGPRIAVLWDRIITPNGLDITMASPGVDNLGGAGHPGYYDAHWGSRMGAALLISLISDAFKYAAAEEGPRNTTITNGVVTQTPFESNTARTMERLAQQALQRAANRPATVTIHQGTMLNVYVARDVDFSGVLGR
ncbi:TrbI/VirB10 family protein [Vulcaniibacterium gelatinicum]|uniref:TrbI/VirB10 family protein n=1 Tax=Vulcaniibacterium gelatinicum TaxID=2598725 RepID=UPI0011CB8C5F|nr:TrbI/VirB10 family protein [Vulcaniibacterium gelatinicum]